MKKDPKEKSPRAYLFDTQVWQLNKMGDGEIGKTRMMFSLYLSVLRVFQSSVRMNISESSLNKKVEFNIMSV